MNRFVQPNPAQVPVLTEIVDIPVPPESVPVLSEEILPEQVAEARPEGADTPAPPSWNPMDTVALPVLDAALADDQEALAALVSEPRPPELALASAEPVIDEGELAQRVMGDVQRRIDSMLEFRLREAMTPLLARHVEALVHDLRDELAHTMRDVVARAVAQEMAKRRQR